MIDSIFGSDISAIGLGDVDLVGGAAGDQGVCARACIEGPGAKAAVAGKGIVTSTEGQGSGKAFGVIVVDGQKQAKGGERICGETARPIEGGVHIQRIRPEVAVDVEGILRASGVEAGQIVEGKGICTIAAADGEGDIGGQAAKAD